MCSQLRAGSQARPQEEGDPQGPPYKWQGGAGAGCCRFVLDALACGQPEQTEAGQEWREGQGQQGQERRILRMRRRTPSLRFRRTRSPGGRPWREACWGGQDQTPPPPRQAATGQEERHQGACRAGQEKEGQTSQKRPRGQERSRGDWREAHVHGQLFGEAVAEFQEDRARPHEGCQRSPKLPRQAEGHRFKAWLLTQPYQASTY